jgi:hypothetical protein
VRAFSASGSLLTAAKVSVASFVNVLISGLQREAEEGYCWVKLSDISRDILGEPR